MTAMSLLLAVACAGVGCVVGWWIVPRGADFLLKRAYGRTTSWWWDSYRGYCAYKSTHPHNNPTPSACGEEGALGIWLTDALRAARAGSLPRERVEALTNTGLSVDARRALRDESDQEARCTFVAKRWQRVVCAGVCAVWGGGLALLGVPGPLLVTLAVCGLSMTMAIVCDLRARLLPLECCGALAVAGGIFQVGMAGISGLVIGAAFGLVISVGCVVANRLFNRSGAAPVGLGDVRCMAALSLTCGVATPVGLATCYVSAALFSVGGLVTRKLALRDGIPMAPFLALWLVGGVGVLACG